MKILFSIPYETQPGQSLLMTGSTIALGQWDAARGLRMRCDAGRLWWALVPWTDTERRPLTYRYAIEDLSGVVVQTEGGPVRCFTAPECPGMQTVVQRDFWQPASDPEAVLLSAPFRRVLFRRDGTKPLPACPDRSQGMLHVRLTVSAARVPPGHSVRVTGSTPALGLWNPEKALPLSAAAFPCWQADFHLNRAEMPIEYKYCLAAPGMKDVIWESGENRRLEGRDISGAADCDALSISDHPFRCSAARWRGAGLAVPVFSLRTAGGLGVGEFPDLKPLTDWAKQMGLQMIQILPVHDTSIRLDWRDAYPYATLSVFALHPLYLNLQAVGGLSESLRRDIEAAAERLNREDTVDYEAVMAAKTAFLKIIYREQAAAFLDSAAFRRFLQENAGWLRPYAAFCLLRDRHGTGDFRAWGSDSSVTPAAIDQMTGPDSGHYPEMAFHFFVQYHLHRQLLEASEYARAQGVVLKGDIPIGVDRTSVETWLHPEWFNLQASAGAPPDDFAVQGQNWGFPPCNWEAMAADGYGWWRRRLMHLSRYFDAVRLDHVLGFFRIWEIPGDAVTALRGRFSPAIPLSKQELQAAGIADPDRLCEAHITDDVLRHVFADRASEVLRTFLEPSAAGRYRFRSAYASQQQVAARFCLPGSGGGPPTEADRRLLDGLFCLSDDVLLIPDPASGGNAYHPRIALEGTFAFKALDPRTRNEIRRLYEDYFFRRQESLWAQNAREKLSALKSATDMLLCGEDLGMVPHCVPGVLEEMGILSLRIQRMPADPYMLFDDPLRYPYLSVASPSSHDTATIRGWWEEADRAVIQLFYTQILGQAGLAPKSCDPWICRRVVAGHLDGRSIWAVFPVQDILGISAGLRHPDPRAERINEPANARHRWNFRLHHALEALLSQQRFSGEVLSMVRASGRLPGAC